MEELRRLRKAKGLSQAKLAVMAGLDPSTVSQIETGTRRANTRTLERLAAVLGAEVADLFPKAEAPLPLEWALSTPDEAFHRSVEGAPTGELRGLIAGLVAGERPRLLEEERDEETPAAVLYERSVRFARALIVREELLRRGEGPPERELLALRRYMNALELTDDPALGRYRAEELFPPEQVAAFLAQDERDREFIARELEKMSANDFREALLASPGMRRIRDYHRDNDAPPASKPPRSETA